MVQVKYEINKNITWKSLDTGIILLNLDSGDYFTLNEIASFIWKGLLEDKGLDDIVGSIVDSYDCDKDTAEKDVNEQIKDLLEEKVITISQGGESHE